MIVCKFFIYFFIFSKCLLPLPDIIKNKKNNPRNLATLIYPIRCAINNIRRSQS